MRDSRMACVPVRVRPTLPDLGRPVMPRVASPAVPLISHRASRQKRRGSGERDSVANLIAMMVMMIVVSMMKMTTMAVVVIMSERPTAPSTG